MEVDLRPVEGAVALVDRVGQVEFLERAFQSLGRRFPVLVGTHAVLRAGRQFDEVLETELGVDLVDQVHDAHDLVGDLLAAHEDMRVVLRKAADPEQPVERPAQFVAVHQTEFAHPERQFPVTVRLTAVDHHAAGAVHGLHAVDLVVDRGGVHIVFVMIPVSAGLPKVPVHDHRRRDLDVVLAGMQVAPVFDQGVLQRHTLREEEREARRLVAEHEQTHLAPDPAVVAPLGFLKQFEVRVELLLGLERRPVDAGQHLVVLVVLPVRARLTHNLERLERLGVGQVGTDAHIDVVALLEEADLRVFGKVADVLDLVDLAPLLHQSDRLVAREDIRFQRKILFGDLLHLGFDLREVLVGQLDVAEIHVVVEALFGRGSVREFCLGPEPLDRLRHDVRGGVTEDMKLLLGRALAHRSVAVNDFHWFSPFGSFSVFRRIRAPRKQKPPGSDLSVQGCSPHGPTLTFHSRAFAPPRNGGLPAILTLRFSRFRDAARERSSPGRPRRTLSAGRSFSFRGFSVTLLRLCL